MFFRIGWNKSQSTRPQRSRVGQMKSRLARAKQLYKVGHPELKAAETQFADAEKHLTETSVRLEPTIVRRIEAEQGSAV